jgi:hypothetical protein
VRWLEDKDHDSLSDYMLASEARVLADKISPELRYAGIQINGTTRRRADYWHDFVAPASAATEALA